MGTPARWSARTAASPCARLSFAELGRDLHSQRQFHRGRYVRHHEAIVLPPGTTGHFGKSFDDGQRWDNEHVMSCRQFGKARFGHRVGEDMSQSVRPGIDGLAGILLRRRVDEDKLVAAVRGGDDVLELLLRQRRERVLVDDLDVLRALGDAGIDKRLGVVVRPDRRDRRAAHLGGMALRHRDTDAGGPEVGRIRRFRGAHLLPQRQARGRAPHLQLCGNTEGQSSAQEGLYLHRAEAQRARRRDRVTGSCPRRR